MTVRRLTSHRSRARTPRGRTLAEMLVVLAVLGAMAASVAPALRASRDDRGAGRVARALHARLQSARATAARRTLAVTVVLDPATGRLWGAVGADAPLVADSLSREPLADDAVAIVAGGSRARWTFLPAGGAFGDDVLVRDARDAFVVSVDPWTGAPRVTPR